MKPINIHLYSHCNIYSVLCPINDEEKKYMYHVPYANAVRILMYLMVCTRPDNSHEAGVVSTYMENQGKEHWAAPK